MKFINFECFYCLEIFEIIEVINWDEPFKSVVCSACQDHRQYKQSSILNKIAAITSRA